MFFCLRSFCRRSLSELFEILFRVQPQQEGGIEPFYPPRSRLIVCVLRSPQTRCLPALMGGGVVIVERLGRICGCFQSELLQNRIIPTKSVSRRDSSLRRGSIRSDQFWSLTRRRTAPKVFELFWVWSEGFFRVFVGFVFVFICIRKRRMGSRRSRHASPSNNHTSRVRGRR